MIFAHHPLVCFFWDRVRHSPRLGTAVLFLVGLFGWAASPALMATDNPTRLYKVEFLVFKYLSPQTLEQPDGTQRPPERTENDYYLADQQPLMPFQVARVAEEKLSLQGAARRLGRAAGYRILQYGGWYQPLSKRNDKILVRIAGGESFDDKFELEGTLSLYRNRFLHIRADVALMTYRLMDTAGKPRWTEPGLSSNSPVDQTVERWNDQARNKPLSSMPTLMTSGSIDQPAAIALPGAENPTEVRQPRYEPDLGWKIRESRKIKIKELHLLDHPYFGILVMVDSLDLEPQTAPSETTEGSEPSS